MRCIFLICALVLSTQEQRLPIPAAADQKKAESEIKDLFKDQFSKKDRKSKATLAKSLMEQAKDPNNTPASRYVLLGYARDNASESLDFDLSFAAVDQLNLNFEMVRPLLSGAVFTSNLVSQKVALLNQTRKLAVSSDDTNILAEAHLKIAQFALVGRSYDDAITEADQASKMAKDPGITARAKDLSRDIPLFRQEEESAAKSETLLTSKPDDQGANLILGQYLLFVKKDEERAFLCLAKCSDFKDLVQKEQAKPTSADALSEIAESWISLAQKEKNQIQKRRYQTRAREFLDHALPSATGLVKLRIEKRLGELELKGSPGSKPTTDLLKSLDAKKGILSGDWKIDGGALTGSHNEPAHAKIQLNCLPPDEYDIMTTVTRESGSGDFFFGLIGGGKQFTFHFDGWGGSLCGMCRVDGTEPNTGSPKVEQKTLIQGKERSLKFKVRKDGLIVQVDGKEFLSWKGKWSQVSLNPVTTVPKDNTLFIGFFGPGSFKIRTLILSPQ